MTTKETIILSVAIVLLTILSFCAGWYSYEERGIETKKKLIPTMVVTTTTDNFGVVSDTIYIYKEK